MVWLVTNSVGTGVGARKPALTPDLNHVPQNIEHFNQNMPTMLEFFIKLVIFWVQNSRGRWGRRITIPIQNRKSQSLGQRRTWESQGQLQLAKQVSNLSQLQSLFIITIPWHTMMAFSQHGFYTDTLTARWRAAGISHANLQHNFREPDTRFILLTGSNFLVLQPSPAQDQRHEREQKHGRTCLELHSAFLQTTFTLGSHWAAEVAMHISSGAAPCAQSCLETQAQHWPFYTAIVLH